VYVESITTFSLVPVFTTGVTTGYYFYTEKLTLPEEVNLPNLATGKSSR
jgi:hypothetical protein